MLQLQLINRIPYRDISLSDNDLVYSLCALSDDVVLLACGEAGLRAVSLNNSQLSPQFNLYKMRGIEVNGVALDERTDTLLLVEVSSFVKTMYWELVSLRRDRTGWTEVTRLATDIPRGAIFDIAVCDSRVLIRVRGETNRNGPLHVFNVSANHSVSAAGCVQMKQQKYGRSYGLACARRGNNTYPYIAFTRDSSVSLHWLVSQPLSFEHIMSFKLKRPIRLLFHGGLVLVADWNSNLQSQDIVSLRVSAIGLTDKRVLLGAEADIQVGTWAFAGN